MAAMVFSGATSCRHAPCKAPCPQPSAQWALKIAIRYCRAVEAVQPIIHLDRTGVINNKILLAWFYCASNSSQIWVVMYMYASHNLVSFQADLAFFHLMIILHVFALLSPSCIVIMLHCWSALYKLLLNLPYKLHIHPRCVYFTPKSSLSVPLLLQCQNVFKSFGMLSPPPPPFRAFTHKGITIRGVPL